MTSSWCHCGSIPHTEGGKKRARALWGYFVTPPAKAWVAKIGQASIINSINGSERSAALFRESAASMVVLRMERQESGGIAVSAVWQKNTFTVYFGEGNKRERGDWHWIDSLLSIWHLFEQKLEVRDVAVPGKEEKKRESFWLTAQVRQLSPFHNNTMDASIVLLAEGPSMPPVGNIRIVGGTLATKGKRALSELRGDWENFPHTSGAETAACAAKVLAKIPDRNCFSILGVYQSIEPSVASHDQGGDTIPFRYQESLIAKLPQRCSANIAGYLSPKSIQQLRATCRQLWASATLNEFIPGCNLHLKNHQQRNLKWMLKRETGEREVLSVKASLLGGWSETGPTSSEHVRWNRIQNACTSCKRPCDAALALDTLLGVVKYADSVAPQRRVCGGMLCDEPGLGKTVTTIALCLRTMGQLARDCAWTYEDESKLKMRKARYIFETIDENTKRRLAANADALRICTGDLDVNQFEKLHGAAGGRLIDELEQMWNDQFCSSRKRISCPIAASILSENNRRELRHVISTPASLFVVPKTLVSHWENQIRKVVDEGYINRLFSGQRRLVYVDTGERWSDPEETIRRLASNYCFVVLSTLRITRLWREDLWREDHATALRSVYWLRMVIDEGATLGASSITNMRQGLSSARVERSWIVSGTPTKESNDAKASKVALKSVFRLLQFMRHPTFFVDCASDTDYGDEARPMMGERGWRFLVSKAYARGHPQARARVVGLLTRVMMRHTKEIALRGVPPPKKKVVFLEMSPSEVENYNTRASLALTNLALTTREGGRLEKQSLLVKENRKDMHTQITFLRLMCVGGGPLTVHISSANRRMTETMLASEPCQNPVCKRRLEWRESRAYPRGFHNSKPMDENYHLCIAHSGEHDGYSGFGAGPRVVQKARSFMNRVVRGNKTVCSVCSMPLVLQIITPCGHFICCECVGKSHANRSRCYECGAAYTFDELQLLQPGFDIDFTETLEEIGARRTFPQSAMQTQKNDEFVGGTKSKYIIDKLKKLRSEKRSPDDAPLKVVIFSQFKSCLNYVGHDLLMEFGANSFAEHFGVHRTEELRKFKENKIVKWWCAKCGYENQGVDPRCRQLHYYLEQEDESKSWVPSSRIEGYFLGRRFRPGDTVYAFNETRTDGFSGIVRNIKFCGTPCTGAKRKPVDVDCFIMLLYKDGSHGLDLSFVNHIILLETVWDEALEKQIVARGYRMGASRRKALEVEYLVMKNTIEHHMHRIHKENKDTGGSKPMSHRRLLTGLKLLRQPAALNVNATKTKKRKRARIVTFSSLSSTAPVSSSSSSAPARMPLASSSSASARTFDAAASSQNRASSGSVPIIVEDADPAFKSAVDSSLDLASNEDGDQGSYESAEDALIHRLLDPTGGSLLQNASKGALDEAYETALANSRFSASFSRNFTIKLREGAYSLSREGGRDVLDVVFKGHADEKENKESVKNLGSKVVVAAVVRNIYLKGGASSRENLKAYKMARVSPCVFWNLVHYSMGDGSVEDAVREIINGIPESIRNIIASVQQGKSTSSSSSEWLSGRLRVASEKSKHAKESEERIKELEDGRME